MKKNLFALLGAVAVGFGLVGCSNDKDSGKSNATEADKTINIRCWNTEFMERFENFYAAKIEKNLGEKKYLLKSGNTVVFNVVPNDDNAYQNALDAALKADDSAKASEKIDMFLMEADYAKKYIETEYTLDIKKDVGLTDTDLGDMYDYTKTVVTNTAGVLKGVSWQATPGLYAFRSDEAEKLWDDYPKDSEGAEAQAAFVQSKINTWDKFNAVAALAKEKGIKMLSGYDDSYRTFSNNATKAWVTEAKDGKLTVHLDDQLKSWIKQTKEFSTNGYNNRTSLWDNTWAKDQGPSGDVFGFFYSTWGINFTLLGNSLADSKAEQKLGNGLYGKYRVCQGPASYYWGGTWLAASKNCNNIDDVKDIMKTMTCDATVAEKITRETQDYTNNKTAMNKLASDTTYKSDFLGGQNHIKLFKESAASIKLAPMSAYDQGCNEKLQAAMKDYFKEDNPVTFETAIKTFKTNITTTYPELAEATFDSSFDSL